MASHSGFRVHGANKDPIWPLAPFRSGRVASIRFTGSCEVGRSPPRHEARCGYGGSRPRGDAQPVRKGAWLAARDLRQERFEGCPMAEARGAERKTTCVRLARSVARESRCCFARPSRTMRSCIAGLAGTGIPAGWAGSRSRVMQSGILHRDDSVPWVSLGPGPGEWRLPST